MKTARGSHKKKDRPAKPASTWTALEHPTDWNHKVNTPNVSISPTQQQPDDALRDRADELLVGCRDVLASADRRLRHVLAVLDHGGLDEVTRPAAQKIVDGAGHAIERIRPIVEHSDDETRIDGALVAMTKIQHDLEEIQDLARETFGRVEDGVEQAIETPEAE